MSYKHKLSFGALSPEARFVIVFAASNLFILINSLVGATFLFLVGLTVFLLGEKRNWKLAISAPFSGGMMLLYNAILSPKDAGGISWLFFTINASGVERGLVTGLRLTGIMLLSFAWLAATPIPEMYQGVAWLKPARETVLGVLRGVQILQREFVVLTQSLIIRGLAWNSVAANVRNLVPLATAIMPRVIENAQKATFAQQSHKKTSSTANGKVEVEGLHVRYSPTLPDVLEGIDITVEPDEFVYLAGRNASGKTTLLRAMGGVIPWIMGEMRGRVVSSGMVTHKTSLARLCGAVRYVAPDPFASIHGLTVGQEISFIAQSRKEAESALSVMGIDSLWERETTKLSGGQQVRLVLAGVLASRARVLLLDSPMQELDPQGRADFMDALSILRTQRPSTIITADPFWRQLKPYTERVLVLHEGKLRQNLSPGKFFTQANLELCRLNEVCLERSEVAPGKVVAQMNGVEVVLDGNLILRGVDFTLREGELVAIVGPNGSGKTTAMLALAGAIKPSKGEAVADGRVGYIFQNAALQLLSMTVEEELAFGPKMLKWQPGMTSLFVTKGLSWTGLERSECPLDIHPGEQRLLAIAACNTDVATLVFDEPTIGLDSAGVAKVVELIDSLRREGKAIVVITHDEFLALHADRVITIEGGKISAEIQGSVLSGGGV